ncbi:MAG: gliding motility-associated C-terminal domain-containing protein [Bacteroidia bacterium]|nr:gliding motility-associated C-terminal domain-containing protein [Bacteroidia bacterium]
MDLQIHINRYSLTIKTLLVAGLLIFSGTPGLVNAQGFWIENFGNTSGTCDQGTIANNFVTANGTWVVTSIGAQDVFANEWYISSTEPGLSPGSCSIQGCHVNSSLTDRTLHVGNVPGSPNAMTLCSTGDCGAVYDPGGFQLVVLTDKRAESPVIDCSGQAGIFLSFDYFEYGDDAINIDNTLIEFWDGAIWVNISDPPRTNPVCGAGFGTWTNFLVQLPIAADNNPNVKIGFRWQNDNGGTGTSPSFAVDNIQLLGAFPPAADFIATDTVLCIGDCIDFIDQTTNSPSGWSWSFIGATPSTSSVQNPTGICFSAAGTYSVQLISSNGIGIDTITKVDYITVNPCNPPTADFAADTTQMCERSCVNFSDSSTGGATSWQWIFPGGIPATSTDPNPIGICYFNPGSYDVTLIVGNSFGFDTLTIPGFMTIDVCPLPVADFNTFTQNICSNRCVDFFDLSTETPIAWSWYFPGASPDTSSLQNPTNICYDTDGFYDVRLIVTNQYGSDTLLQYSYISVESVPGAFVSPDTSMYFGSTYQLNAGGGSAYTWSPVTGLDTFHTPSPIANPLVTTTYTVSITDSSTGCTATRQVTITILHDNKYFIPNTFSPNGDGRNDYLYLRGNNLYGVRFTIYDRWGEKVFETTDPTIGWDGRYKGKELDPAVFTYVVTVNYDDKKTLTETGNITLVR